MYVVVGSGPAGVSCAKALLDRGLAVKMLDAGLTLEPERVGIVEKLKQQKPDQWAKTDLEAYRADMEANAGGVAVKLAYGSDFPYREASGPIPIEYAQVGLRPSFARGGLSNVWGAAVMPYLKKDMRQWPFGPDALGKHYEAALRLTGLAAERDALEQQFPLYTDQFTKLNVSTQAANLLSNMERNRDSLAKAGISFGTSRLAVRGNGGTDTKGCNYCRLCLYGCPYGYIYNSSDSLGALQTYPQFQYQPGVIVEAVNESAGCVQISGRNISNQKTLRWECERVFLAAGAIPTTQLLLRCLEAFDQPVQLKDSQYFITPLAMLSRQRGARSESLHALSQIFLEISEQAGNTTAHVQLYSNNDLVNEAVANTFGPFRRALGPLVRSLQDRLIVAQGFLHSDLSSGISIRLSKEQGGTGERLRLQAETNPATKREIKKLVFKLLRNARKIGAVPLVPMLKIGEPGRSFHTGGSFPMSSKPGRFESDLEGRPAGLQRIHAVDATVFPSIPATTITLTVMANAHRIGSVAGKATQ